jgi:acyl carrier protein
MEHRIERLKQMVAAYGEVSDIGANDDFYEAGFASVNALNLLLDVESEFGVSLSDEDFASSRTLAALDRAIARAAGEVAA